MRSCSSCVLGAMECDRMSLGGNGVWTGLQSLIPFLQKVEDELVLVLFESASGSVPFNRYTKEEMSRTKIMTFEVLGKKMTCQSQWRIWKQG